MRRIMTSLKILPSNFPFFLFFHCCWADPKVGICSLSIAIKSVRKIIKTWQDANFCFFSWLCDSLDWLEKLWEIKKLLLVFEVVLQFLNSGELPSFSSVLVLFLQLYLLEYAALFLGQIFCHICLKESLPNNYIT